MKSWTQVLVAVFAIVGGVTYFTDWRVNSIEKDIGGISDQIIKLNAPDSGFQAAVRTGVKDAVERAIDKDKTLEATLVAAISAAMASVLKENRDAIGLMRTDIVDELRIQTKQFSADINRLQNEIHDVRQSQEILMHQLIGFVPEDKIAFLKMQQEQLSKGGLSPIWVMEMGAYSDWQDLFMASSKEGLYKSYRWEVSGPFKD